MIAVVYHTFCTGHWKEMVSEQLNKLKTSGLYDAADILWTTINDPGDNYDELQQIYSQHPKFQIQYNKSNRWEYPGIRKVCELSEEHADLKILYFHTLGVSNTYKIFGGSEISERKINGYRGWRHCLEYFMISHWKQCIERLDYYDMVVTTFVDGLTWGNFWWTDSAFIRQHPYPEIRDRWYCEYWIGEPVIQPPPKVYEWHHFTFISRLSDFPEFFYNGDLLPGQKIELISAKYGALDIQTDEAHPVPSGNADNNIVDVTECIRKNLEENNGIKLTTLAGSCVMSFPDPCPEVPEARKCLTVRVKIMNKEVDITFRRTYSDFTLYTFPAIIDNTPRVKRNNLLVITP